MQRAAALGTLRCTRPGPRRLCLEEGEREYLQGHWPVLSRLRSALRAEHAVRFAAVYGSVARGDDEADSDIDLLVDLADERPLAALRLGLRLEAAVGRSVDVTRLQRVRDGSPLLLLQVLDEGRVIVDREGRWPALSAQRRAIRARAARAYEREGREAAAAIRELTAA